jgi:hypothetical protein
MHQLVMRLGERAWVRCQNPVTLRSASEPQPDLALAQREISPAAFPAVNFTVTDLLPAS